MGLLTKLFAPDLDFQTKRADWLDAELTKSEKRRELAEKALQDERNKKDKILLRHADQMTEVAGKKGHFIRDVEPKEQQSETTLFSPEEQLKFEYAAKELRDADLATVNGDTSQVRPLSDYVQRIEEDPTFVFVD